MGGGSGIDPRHVDNSIVFGVLKQSTVLSAISGNFWAWNLELAENLVPTRLM